jgi:hypothetical protein
MDDNTDIVERLRSMYYELSRRQASTPFGERSELDGIPALLYEAAIKIQDLQGNEIERLRNERDEARRECCHLWKEYFYFYKERDHYTPQKLAEEHGWDCFKEDTDD